jgi:hypothetical protein
MLPSPTSGRAGEGGKAGHLKLDSNLAAKLNEERYTCLVKFWYYIVLKALR